MAKWRVTFEIDLPEASSQEVHDWAAYACGQANSLALANPCSHVSLPNGAVEYVNVTRSHCLQMGKSDG